MLKLPVEQRRRRLDTFKVRMQGAEGATFGKQHTSTRTTESGSTILAVTLERAFNLDICIICAATSPGLTRGIGHSICGDGKVI